MSKPSSTNFAAMMMSGKTVEKLPNPIEPAGAADAKEEKSFKLLALPRDGIPLQSDGRDTDVVVARKLHVPEGHKIYAWNEIKSQAASFDPPLSDVCRVTVYSKASGTRHFMLCVQVHANPAKVMKSTQEPYKGELYHPLSYKREMELLMSREFNNVVRFTNEAAALKRISTYNNRLPGHPRLAEEGFISDHHCVVKLPKVFDSHECFQQLDTLEFEEKDLYCPTDMLKQLNPDKGEQAAFDGLAADSEAAWVERPASKKKPAKGKAKNTSRELAEDPIDDDQGSTPKVPTTVHKLKMVKNSNPAPDAEAPASAPPKQPTKRAPKTVSQKG